MNENPQAQILLEHNMKISDMNRGQPLSYNKIIRDKPIANILQKKVNQKLRKNRYKQPKVWNEKTKRLKDSTLVKQVAQNSLKGVTYDQVVKAAHKSSSFFI